MKKIIAFTIVLMTGLSSLCTAGNAPSVRSLIAKKVSIPEQLQHQKLDEKVNVQFTIAPNGTASVIDVQTANPELKQYVTRQLNGINFSEASDKQSTTYFIDINFKVL